MPLPDNPFSSDRTDPTLGNYIFHPDRPLEFYLDTLDKAGWRAALCGPRGAGKTTLLHSLEKEARRRNHQTLIVYCSNQTRLLPVTFWKLLRRDTVFLNSAECLYRPLLLLVRLVTKAFGKGLVLTTHAPCGIQPLIEVEATPWQFEQLVQQLSSTPQGATVAFDKHNGNAREALFYLYDQFEFTSL